MRRLIHFRLENELLKADHFAKNTEIAWHGVEPFHIYWDDPQPFVALSILDKESNEDLYIAFNATHEGIEFSLPQPSKGKSWHVVFDSFATSPHDCFELGKEPILREDKYYVAPYASILLKAF